MRSIELGWLQRGDKALPLPLVAFIEYDAGGCYYWPRRGEIELGGRFVPLDSGVIVCSVLHGSEFTGATLAHEWRHHWQWYNGIKYDNGPWTGDGDYETELRGYFGRSFTERDALRFEMKRAPSPHHDEWRSILRGILLIE